MWKKPNPQINDLGETLRYLVLQHVDQMVTTVMQSPRASDNE